MCMYKSLSSKFSCQSFFVKRFSNNKLIFKLKMYKTFVNRHSSSLTFIIIISHWFECNIFSSILIMCFLIEVKNSLKNRSWLIMWNETSMFTIQFDLKLLLINFLNRTTIFFMFFSLLKLMSMKLSLLIEKISILYVFCLSSLFLFVLIFLWFRLTSFFNFRNKSQFLTLWSSSYKKHSFLDRSTLNSSLMFWLWLKFKERCWNTRYVKY